MSAEANKTLIRRFAETVWNGKNADALDEFHAATFTQNGKTMTLDEMKPQMRTLLAELGEFEHTIEDIITEGDKVAYRWIMRSTNQQTGERESHRGITFMRIVDGKIVEDWYSAEQLEV